MARAFLAAGLACAVCLVTVAAKADILVHSVNGYTLTALGALSRFDALLISDTGKVITTGTRQALSRRSPAADPIDGGGRTLLPGLIDAHGRVMTAGDGGAEPQARLDQGLAALASAGITSVQASDTQLADWPLFRHYAADGRLTARLYAMVDGSGKDGSGALKEGPLKDGPVINEADDRLSLRTVRLGVDASGTGSALSGSALRNRISAAITAGFQLHLEAPTHEDSAEALDALESVLRYRGRELRHRITPGRGFDAMTAGRLVPASIIAVVQPAVAPADTLARLVAERARLALGLTDATGTPAPFAALAAAVALPAATEAAALTVQQALEAMTIGAAFAAGQDSRLGSLEPGKWADFIVVDRDIFKVPVGTIADTQVLETWLAGRQVYARPAEP